MARFASLSRVPPLVFYEKKGVDLSRFSHAADAPLLLLTRGVTKQLPRVLDGNMRVGMLAGLSPFLIDAIPERHGEFWKGRVRWGRARRGFFSL